MHADQSKCVSVANRHRAAVYNLVDYILAHAGDMYTADFDLQIRAVIQSSECFADGLTITEAENNQATAMMYRSHLYLTVQCSALMVFVHAVSAIARKLGDSELNTLTKDLLDRIVNNHRNVFLLPLPG